MGEVLTYSPVEIIAPKLFESEKKRFSVDPCLIILFGTPFAGKSTLAREVAKRSNVIHIENDEYRFKSIGGDFQIADQKEEEKLMVSCYDMSNQDALWLVATKHPVVLSATYWRKAYKPTLENLFDGFPAPIHLFYLHVDDRHIDERSKRRIAVGDVSDVKTFEDYTFYRDNFDQVKNHPFTDIDTGNSLDFCVNKIFTTIAK